MGRNADHIPGPIRRFHRRVPLAQWTSVLAIPTRWTSVFAISRRTWRS